MTARRIVVVGYGMAGARLAEEIRARDPDGERVALTVIGAERHPAYNRVLLSSVLAGALTADSVRLQDIDWAERYHVDLRLDATVARIDRSRRRVVLADGSEIVYDALVLATGSRSWLPPTAGLLDAEGQPAPGVVAFRSLDDCDQIIAAARAGAPVTVLGGGLLGLEAARGLAGRGNLVTVVHPVGHLMERQLDPAGGRVLARILGELGIEFRLGVLATRYLPGEGVELDDGSHLPADLLVVAAGVRAETGLAVDAGLAVDRGVLVDDALRTNDFRIHALGDCAQHTGTVSGLVQPAWEQAAVLADLLTGADPSARYRGTRVVTRLKAKGVDLATIGDTQSDVDSVDAEVVRFEDPARGRYAKLVLHGDQVTGAILLGSPEAAATITQLYDRRSPVPHDRIGLLLGHAAVVTGEANPGDLPGGAVICRCNTVSKEQLVTAWRAGASTVPALADATKATTGCGGCREAVCGIVDWLGAQEPVAS